MNETRKLRIPLKLLALDMIGTLLFAVGLADLFANTQLVPEALRFEGYAVVLIVVGVSLMAPLVVHVVKVAAGAGSRSG